VRAMVTGYKNGLPEQGIRRTWTVIALVLLAAVLFFWWQQWQSAPKAEAASGAVQESMQMERVANSASKPTETEH